MNGHLKHIEEYLLNDSKEEREKFFSFLFNFKLFDYTEKVDGGVNLYFIFDGDGRFHISTKSIYNKTPKIYSSVDDLNDDDRFIGKEDLKQILAECLTLIPSVFGDYKDIIFSVDFLWNKSNKIALTENTILIKSNAIDYKIDSKADWGFCLHTIFKVGNGEGINLFDKTYTKISRGDFLDFIEKEGLIDKCKNGSIFLYITNNLKLENVEELEEKGKSLGEEIKGFENKLNTLCEKMNIEYINTFLNYVAKEDKPISLESLGDFISYRIKVESKKVKLETIQKRYENIISILQENDKEVVKCLKELFLYIEKIWDFKRDILKVIINSNSVLKSNTEFGEGLVCVYNGVYFKIVDRREFSKINFNSGRF